MLVTGLPSCVEGIASAPDAFSLQSLMVTASPTISYVKRSALTSLIPQENNKTNTEKFGLIVFSIVALNGSYFVMYVFLISSSHERKSSGTLLLSSSVLIGPSKTTSPLSLIALRVVWPSSSL